MFSVSNISQQTRVKVSNGDSKTNISSVGNLAEYYANQAKKCTDTCSEILEECSALIESARQSIQENITNITWVSFSAADWILSNNIYTLELNVPMVLGVYDANKSLITNIDIHVTDNVTVLSSINSFSGYVAAAINNIEDEDENEFTEEEMETLVISDWDDII